MSRKFTDLVGSTFNKLLVIKFLGLNKYKKRIWLCECSCDKNNFVIVSSSDLKRGNTNSCGCFQKERVHDTHFINLTGKRFGSLVVNKFVEMKNYGAYWECLCDCGMIKIISSHSLCSRNTKSCGCLKKKLVKHGMCNTRFYMNYYSMIQRCTNPNSTGYPYYGEKGIKVCDRWMKSFENYKEDMYESYLKHVKEFGQDNTSLDRFPNQNGDYCPENTRWATDEEQARNMTFSAKTNDYDSHLRWKNRLHKNLNNILRETYKSNKSICTLYLGLSINEFKKYVESLWLLGMNWNNYGRYKGKWCLDNIVECFKFDLSKEEDRKVCFHYTNLRPSWWIKNSLRLYE